MADLRATLEAELEAINALIAKALLNEHDSATYEGHAESFKKLDELYKTRDSIVARLDAATAAAGGAGPMRSHPGRFI